MRSRNPRTRQDRLILGTIAAALIVQAVALIERPNGVFWPRLWPVVFFAAAVLVLAFLVEWAGTPPWVKAGSGALTTAAFASRAAALLVDTLQGDSPLPTASLAIAVAAWLLLAAYTVFAWVHLLPCSELDVKEAERHRRMS